MTSAEPVAVAGHERDSRLVQLAGPGAGDVVAASVTEPRRRLAQAGEGVDQLVLAVARHARDAQDLAGAHLEADVRGPPRGPGRSFTCRSSTGRTRLAGWLVAAVDGELDLAADHQLGQVVLVRLRGQPLADDLAPADDRDPVSDIQHLVQLVADEDDAVALVAQTAQDGEDLRVSWGVSTAVGSSSTRIRASR